MSKIADGTGGSRERDVSTEAAAVVGTGWAVRVGAEAMDKP
jgi:hypothetical protein